MTYPGGDPLEGLNPTDEERLAYYRALDEAEAEEAGIPYEAGEEEAGPWDDVAEQLGAIGDQVDGHYALEGQRIAEDIVAGLDRRPSDETRLARAMPRIEAGTYTEGAFFRGDEAAAAAMARDPIGRWQAVCGPIDDFGRCSSRYHTPDCHTTVESAAARGDSVAVEAWNDTLQGRAQPPGTDARSLGLATPSEQPGSGADAWADLLEGPGGPASADPRLHARVLHHMGMSEQLPPEPGEPLPNVSSIREALWI